MTSKVPVVLIVFSLATAAGAATAQTPGDSIVVLPGDPLVEPERLVPHRATWRVTRREPDGNRTVQGLWTDTWARSTEDDRPVLYFRQLFVDTAGSILFDSETVFDSASFRAIRSTQYLPPSGARVTYRFSGDTVSGTLRQATASELREFQVVFDKPVWEPLAPVSVLLPLERLESGAVLQYPIWNQVGPGGDVTWREIHVDSVVTTVVADGRAVEARYLTVTVAAIANTVTRLRQTPEPPYYWWFVVERPGRVREWTLVDWEPLRGSHRLPSRSPSPRDQGPRSVRRQVPAP